MKYPAVANYLNGSFVEDDAPRTRRVQPERGQRHLASSALHPAWRSDRAVESARAAFPGWSGTPIKERVQVFYRYKALLEKNIDELAALVTEENGKIASEARAEVLKSAELTRVRLLAAADHPRAKCWR